MNVTINIYHIYVNIVIKYPEMLSSKQPPIYTLCKSTFLSKKPVITDPTIIPIPLTVNNDLNYVFSIPITSDNSTIVGPNPLT